MTTIEIIALVLAVLVLIEFLVWLVRPKWLVKFAETIYAKPFLAQVGLILVAGGLLYLLLQSLTIVEIMAVTLFATIVSGLGMMPFVSEVLSLFRRRMKKGRLLKDFALVWLIWLILSVWTLFELFS